MSKLQKVNVVKNVVKGVSGGKTAATADVSSGSAKAGRRRSSAAAVSGRYGIFRKAFKGGGTAKPN